MSGTNSNAMDIGEYRRIKEALKTMPINKQTASELGRGTTTLATIKKSKSLKHYKELRKLARGKKKTVKQINVEPVKIDVKKTGRMKRIGVIRKEALYADGDMIVVPAALFEAMSDQMSELSREIGEVKNYFATPVAVTGYIPTIDGEPLIHKEKTFAERVAGKVAEIKLRWKK